MTVRSSEFKPTVRAYMEANYGNPGHVVAAMMYYGVNALEVADAWDKPPELVRAYFREAGQASGFGGLYDTPVVAGNPTPGQRTFVAWQMAAPALIGPGTIGDSMRHAGVDPLAIENLKNAQAAIDNYWSQQVGRLRYGLAPSPAFWDADWKLTGDNI